MIRLRSALVPAALALCTNLAAAGGGELSDYDKQVVAELFAVAMSPSECSPAAEHECNTACEETYAASKKLNSMLVKMPASWEEVEPLFLEQYKAADERRVMMVGFLADVGSEGTVATAEKLYKKTPESFTDVHLVAFAERASDTFAEVIHKQVKKSKCETILPAAYLAIHGDDAGAAALKRAVKVEQLDEHNVVAALISAAALDRLEDGQVLAYAQLRVQDAVLAALDAGDLDLARGLAIRAEAVHDAFAGGEKAYGKGKEKVSLSYLDGQIGWHVKKRSTQVATTDDVFKLIERITPVS